MHTFLDRHTMRNAVIRTVAAAALLACGDATGPSRFDGTPPVFSLDYPPSVVADAYQLAAPGFAGRTGVGVRLTNTGASAATIQYGACSVAVWLYRDAAPRSGPVWENRLGTGEACIAIAYVRTLSAGQSHQIGGALLGAETLGDSLPDGRYRVRVAVRQHVADTSPSADRLVVLDAGTIDLSR
jgi:hypothetical protein